MPAINTAEDAISTAERFLTKYHVFRILKKVTRDKDKWVVEFDVAVLGVKVVRVTLDATTGSVVEYNEV